MPQCMAAGGLLACIAALYPCVAAAVESANTGMRQLRAGSNSTGCVENASKGIFCIWQPLDHVSNPGNCRADIDTSPFENDVWQQRYTVAKSSSWDAENGVVFVVLGGNMDIDQTRQQLDLPTNLANQNQGAVVVLEHRFYGQSIPTVSTTKADLAFLSAQQAMRDQVSLSLSEN